MLVPFVEVYGKSIGEAGPRLCSPTAALKPPRP